MAIEWKELGSGENTPNLDFLKTNITCNSDGINYGESYLKNNNVESAKINFYNTGTIPTPYKVYGTDDITKSEEDWILLSNSTIIGVKNVNIDCKDYTYLVVKLECYANSDSNNYFEIVSVA